MTIEDRAYGYSLLKDAILGGSNIEVNPKDDYDVGMHYAYAALKDLILDFEESIQNSKAMKLSKEKRWIKVYDPDALAEVLKELNRRNCIIDTIYCDYSVDTLITTYFITFYQSIDSDYKPEED